MGVRYVLLVVLFVVALAPAGAAQAPGILVLPFWADDPGIGARLTDHLLFHLRRQEGLRVIAPEEPPARRLRSEEAASQARALGANVALTGQVVEASVRSRWFSSAHSWWWSRQAVVRVHVFLVDAATGRVVAHEVAGRAYATVAWRFGSTWGWTRVLDHELLEEAVEEAARRVVETILPALQGRSLPVR